MIGVNSAKDVVRGRLHLEPPALGVARRGLYALPDDRDLGYFNQLLAERLVYKVVAGQRFSVWSLFPEGERSARLPRWPAMPLCVG